jgi:Protein of unknown function (DUF2946)
MDEIVIRAMHKWPNVPNVFGWLRLDRRGNWLVKTQIEGQGKATFDRIANAGVIDFIGRNYQNDERGRWYFQNGPQRVFVSLEYTPLVYRLRGDGKSIETHTGAAATIKAAWADDGGMLVLETEHGAGVVLDRDLPALLGKIVVMDGKPADDTQIESLAAGKGPQLALALGKRRVPLGSIAAADVARRFGFDPNPRPAAGEPEC